MKPKLSCAELVVWSDRYDPDEADDRQEEIRWREFARQNHRD